ncbi:MAG: FliA/WhiG family RNA polymerase sigma factor [Acidaminobacteraceae bacterium]
MTVDNLWKEYKIKNDKSAKEQLIVKYIELVKIISGRLYTSYNAHVEYDDLVSYGIIGLIDAIEKFDLSKQIKFETYANIRIRGAVIDQLRTLDWIPRSARQKSKEFEEALNKLQNTKGSSFTNQDIADELGVTLADVNKLIGEISTFSMISLEEKISENSNFSIKSNQSEFNPEANLMGKELNKSLEKAIDFLPEREKVLVSLYYYSELTYKEIAEVLEISESRISQLHTKIISKLKIALEKEL